MLLIDALETLKNFYVGNTKFKSTILIPPTEVIKPTELLGTFEACETTSATQSSCEDWRTYNTTKAKYVKDLAEYDGSLPSRLALINAINRGAIEVFSRFEVLTRTISIDSVRLGDSIPLPVDLYDITNVTFNDGYPCKVSSKYLNTNEVYLYKPSPFIVQLLSSNRCLDADELAKEEKYCKIHIEYLAVPPKLENVGDFLDIPTNLENLLLIYAGYLIQTSISGSIQAENNTYYLRYEAEARKIERSAKYSNIELDYDTKSYYSGINAIT